MMFLGESVSFSCGIDVSSGWEYLWYKDGEPLGEISNRITISLNGTTHQGSYKCQAKRGKNQKFVTDTSQGIRLTVEGKFMLMCSYHTGIGGVRFKRNCLTFSDLLAEGRVEERYCTTLLPVLLYDALV